MNNENQNKLWFKRRRYGYGWIPTTWQGWATIGGGLVLVAGGAFTLPHEPKNTMTPEVAAYLIFVGIVVIGLIVICRRKGPPPKWRWGKKSDDNPTEDF